MGSQMARHWIIGAVVMYGFGAIANAWVMRGAALRLGRVDDSSRLGYCRAVMLGTFVRSTPKPLLNCPRIESEKEPQASCDSAETFHADVLRCL
jgi:hypothetical protein